MSSVHGLRIFAIKKDNNNQKPKSDHWLVDKWNIKNTLNVYIFLIFLGTEKLPLQNGGNR